MVLAPLAVAAELALLASAVAEALPPPTVLALAEAPSIPAEAEAEGLAEAPSIPAEAEAEGALWSVGVWHLHMHRLLSCALQVASCSSLWRSLFVHLQPSTGLQSSCFVVLHVPGDPMRPKGWRQPPDFPQYPTPETLM